MRTSQRPVRVFISYSHGDEPYRERLEINLTLLQRQGLIESWHDRRICAGDDWDHAISAELEAADVVLLLISADFLASDYIWERELNRAMVRHEAGDVRVIPILIRHCDLEGTPFQKLQAVPAKMRPVNSWTDPDEAWAEVTRAIRMVVDFGTASSPPLMSRVPTTITRGRVQMDLCGLRRQGVHYLREYMVVKRPELLANELGAGMSLVVSRGPRPQDIRAEAWIETVLMTVEYDIVLADYDSPWNSDAETKLRQEIRDISDLVRGKQRGSTLLRHLIVVYGSRSALPDSARMAFCQISTSYRGPFSTVTIRSYDWLFSISGG